MTNEVEAGDYLDGPSLCEMLIRWKIATEHVARREACGDIAESAIRTLINRDFPLLLSVVKKSRPDLWDTGITQRGAES